MSLLTVGISHHSAPIEAVEKVVAGVVDQAMTRRELRAGDDIAEAVLIVTCNRVEAYVEVSGFHGGLDHVLEVLSTASGMGRDEMSEHLYVHYADRAVAHLFSLACGLDSMAVGESQILGQVRQALADAQRHDDAGAGLNPLFQRALRVGKRAHHETAIDGVSRSMVQLALDRAGEALDDLAGARTVVVGAGAMSGLATATLARAGIGELTVVNRSAAKAERLATAHGGVAASWQSLPEHLATADLVVACTGASGHVISLSMLRAARGPSTTPLVVVDLALPRDVDPEVESLPGVQLWSIARLQREQQHVLDRREGQQDALNQVRDMVTADVAEFLAEQRATAVGPTVTALRSSAQTVVEAELARLLRRLPDLTDVEQAEVRQSMRRVVDKLLHTPTVRVKELSARESSGGDYASILRELFDLDPHDTAAVTTPPRLPGTLS